MALILMLPKHYISGVFGAEDFSSIHNAVSEAAFYSQDALISHTPSAKRRVPVDTDDGFLVDDLQQQHKK